MIKKGFLDLVENGKAGSAAKYRVVPDGEVEKRRLGKGLTHWVKIGSGLKAVPGPEESEEDDD